MVQHGLSVSQNYVLTLTYQAAPTRVLVYIDTALQTRHTTIHSSLAHLGFVSALLLITVYGAPDKNRPQNYLAVFSGNHLKFLHEI